MQQRGTSSPQTVHCIPTPQGPSLALLCRAPQHASPWPSRTHAPSSSSLIFAPPPPRPTPAPRSISGEHTTDETATATSPPVALAMEVHRARNGEELSVQLGGTVYNLLSLQMPPFFRQGVLDFTSHCVPQDVVALIPSLFAVISLVRVLQILRGNRDAVRFPATAVNLCGDGVRLQRAPPPHRVKSTAKLQSGCSDNTPRWRSTPAATPPVGEAAWRGWRMV
ncbi:regulator of sigma E protease [Trypanosoma cruzi]|nr:regulator of sigma E protease [Trypanosoma cruzi]